MSGRSATRIIPFVLASTSVVQEGIDFHWWSHSVIHWNLPSNPVDFEQREGRVNRFAGHAVRKNVAESRRADVLAACGMTVLISDYFEYYRLAAYLGRHTKKQIGIVMGAGSLHELFEEQYYSNLDGGILESFGRLFKNDLKLYVYPLLDRATNALTTVQNLEVAPKLRKLSAKTNAP